MKKGGIDGYLSVFFTEFLYLNYQICNSISFYINFGRVVKGGILHNLLTHLVIASDSVDNRPEGVHSYLIKTINHMNNPSDRSQIDIFAALSLPYLSQRLLRALQ